MYPISLSPAYSLNHLRKARLCKQTALEPETRALRVAEKRPIWGTINKSNQNNIFQQINYYLVYEKLQEITIRISNLYSLNLNRGIVKKWTCTVFTGQNYDFGWVWSVPQIGRFLATLRARACRFLRKITWRIDHAKRNVLLKRKAEVAGTFFRALYLLLPACTGYVPKQVNYPSKIPPKSSIPEMWQRQSGTGLLHGQMRDAGRLDRIQIMLFSFGSRYPPSTSVRDGALLENKHNPWGHGLARQTFQTF